MSKLNEPAYLRSQQYRTPANLNARQRLNMLFSTSPVSWFAWVFEQIDFAPGGWVLELGCGPGDLWQENLTRLPPDASIVLSDFSAGMLERTAQNLPEKPFYFTCLDAGHIPFPENWFNTVIANHMLYHLPDLEGGLMEIRRVLKPGGKLYAATNSERSNQEIEALSIRFDPAQASSWQHIRLSFTLESGAATLAREFEDITCIRLSNTLEVTKAAPLADYILSMSSLSIPGEKKEELTHFIEQEIARQGGTFHITKDPGIFIASKPSVS